MKKTVFLGRFALGGAAYVGLELLWRGRSHPSMFVAGGTCFLLIGQLNRALRHIPLLLRAVAGAGIVTVVELCVGLLVNRNFEVWDYRDQTGNFLGQICPMFTLLWIPVSLMALFLHEKLQRGMENITVKGCAYL